MTNLQKYQLEWAHVSQHRWELQNRADGAKAIASLILNGEQWKQQVENPNGGYTSGLNKPFLEARSWAEAEALKLWAGHLKEANLKSQASSEAESEAIEVDVY